jgi:hypothetical protein
MAERVKRGYSRAFKAHGTSGRRYLLDDIPAGFWAEVRAKAKKDGYSIRGAILTLLKGWADGDVQMPAKASEVEK